MRSIPYALLKANYPDKTSTPAAQLYAEIGHPELSQNMYWVNTCAVRVSLALVKSGIAISPGHMTIKAGKHAGSRIEQGQARLSRALIKMMGQPEVYKGGSAAQKGIGSRRGIISFYKVNGATDLQGHIDLVEPGENGYYKCASDCYWGSAEVWFWPLK